MLEVLIGVVEDEEGPAAQRRELGGERAGEIGGLGGEGLGVGGVGGGVRRVELAERGGDRLRGGDGVLGVEPEVAVVGGVVAGVVAGVRVVAGLERTAGAGGQQRRPRGRPRASARPPPGARAAIELGEPGGEGGADPDHEIRLLEHARLGGAQGIAVRRGAGRQDHARLAHARHHPRGDRLDRRDVGHDPRRGGGRRERQAERQGAGGRRGSSGSSLAEMALVGGRTPRLGSQPLPRVCYKVTNASVKRRRARGLQPARPPRLPRAGRWRRPRRSAPSGGCG